MSEEIPQHLRRGKACVPCRKRKMKCDGNQPICNQCLRFSRATECEFKEGPSPSTARELEQHISRLESRIAELETDHPNSIRLHDPYSQSRAAAQAPSRASPAPHSAEVNWWDLPEPPAEIQQILVQLFLKHASKIGFFFDSERFFRSMFSLTGIRLPSVIRNAVYLWGITLSRSAQYTTYESKFLSRALRSVHVSLSACSAQQRRYPGQHEGNALDVLQASVLLANYFFHHNRLLEGRFHASAAVSLAHMCNLHKMFSPTGPVLSGASDYLPSPVDVTEECERVHAWWTVYALDKTWAVALGSPSVINEEQERATVVDTPWPVGMDLYRQQPTSSRPNLGSTTRRFFADIMADNINDPSCLAFIAKAATLYERANYVASCMDRNAPNYHAALGTLDVSIERFKQILPPIERTPQPPADMAHVFLLVHGFTHCATIQLHRRFILGNSTSMTRSLTAANTVVRVIQALDLTRMEFVNPIIGILASTASDVLTQGLVSMRSSRTAGASTSALQVPGEERFISALNRLCAALGGVSGSPFIEHQTMKIREALIAL